MKKVIGYSFLFVCACFLPKCIDGNEHTINTLTKNNLVTKEHTVEKITTDSGLQYTVLEEGTGESPKKGQRVTVHYTGWLEEHGSVGRKFDSSVDRGEPFTITAGVGQVIQGWDESLLGMKVGEKRRLVIPPALGYGACGVGGIIPPHATLIFEVELLKVA